jgi:hypothetical protein
MMLHLLAIFVLQVFALVKGNGKKDVFDGSFVRVKRIQLLRRCV